MKIMSFSNNDYDENAYLVIRNEDVTLIDPGFNYNAIENYLLSNNVLLTRILLTHGHADHIGELSKLIKNTDVKVYINELDVPFLENDALNCSKNFGAKLVIKDMKNIVPVRDKDDIDGFIFFHTPGHTQGSSIIKLNNLIFTGDTLFKGSIGRTDLPTGSLSSMNQSLKFIVSFFPKESIILPGHYERSTLKDEIKNNAYLIQLKKEKRK